MKRILMMIALGTAMGCEQHEVYKEFDSGDIFLQQSQQSQSFEISSSINEVGRPADRNYEGSTLNVRFYMTHFAREGCFNETCTAEIQVALERDGQVTEEVFHLQPGEGRSESLELEGWFDDCAAKESCEVHGLLTITLANDAWVRSSVQASASLFHKGRELESLALEGTLQELVPEDSQE